MAVLPGFAHAEAVLTDPSAVIRTCKVGTNVASQIGQPFDSAEYLGPEEDGSCSYCHLLKFEFEGNNNRIRCVTCVAAGELKIRPDGNVRPVWEGDAGLSCMTLKGKWQEGLFIERQKLPEVAAKLDMWKDSKVPLLKLPSHESSSNSSGKVAGIECPSWATTFGPRR